MFQNLFIKPLFPNRAAFRLAIALTAFNLVILALFALLRMVFHLPNPLTQLQGVASLEDVHGFIGIASMWAIGNILLLLGILDAVRPGKKQPKA